MQNISSVYGPSDDSILVNLVVLFFWDWGMGGQVEITYCCAKFRRLRKTCSQLAYLACWL